MDSRCSIAANEDGSKAFRLPDFLGIGTQKGGTTSLQWLLEQHPETYLPTAKELHYFSLHTDRGPGWYSSHFAEAGPQQCCGEITPYYLFHPYAPRRIKALVPQARMIVLLRDPVERALSQYFHARRHGFEPLELEDALTAERERLAEAEADLVKPGSQHTSHQKHSYVSRSRYGHQLAAYEQLFSTSQLLVLKSEELFNTTEQCWQSIQTFLGINSIHLPAPLPRANAGRQEATNVPESVRRQLRQALAPTVETIRARYGFDWNW